MTIIDKILSSSLAISPIAYWILLIVISFEAMPFLGYLVPGQSVAIIGGFLVKERILGLGYTLLFIFLGILIGDFIAYYLGRKFGYSLIKKYGKNFFFQKKYFDKTKKLMKKHAGKSLMIGRFHSVTRVFVPFVAGLTEINLIKFSAYTLIGAFIWTIIFVSLGWLFGQSYELISKLVGGINILIIIVLIIFFIYKFFKKKK